MIVIGADTHKRTHTVAAVFAASGQLAGELTAPAREPGFRELLAWGCAIDADRIWALEDCRHVSGAFERFLVAMGERVVRVAPKLMGATRKGERARGKSDPIDARAVARAALQEGPEALPAAHRDEEALRIKLLLDHRDDLVKARTEDQQRLRWHLHDLWPELQVPTGALDRKVWHDRLARKLSRAEQTTRAQIARELVLEIGRRTRRINELQRQLAELVSDYAPGLLALEGCGSLSAAKIVAETAGVRRLGTDAKFARLAAVAPIPASSGKRIRYRLDRGGNRQLNRAIHCIAVSQGHCYPPAREFLARKQAEGKSRREALRCLKRHLARRIWKLLVESEIDRSTTTADSQRGSLSPRITAAA